MPARTPFADLSAPQQAGILANDEAFRRYVAQEVWKTDGGACAASAAAAFIRRHCSIESRRDLATDPDARARFDTLRTDFDAWRGRTAAPR